MKVLEKIFNILSAIVLAAIVIDLAIAAPILFGYKPMVVLSGSMEPTYKVGSVLYCHSVSFDQLQEGDPVTFKAGDSLVTHRIVQVNGLSRTLITKGDNNDTEDPQPVEEAAVTGKATRHSIPYAGYYINYAKKPIVIVIMVAILVISSLLESDKNEDKKDKKKE